MKNSFAASNCRLLDWTFSLQRYRYFENKFASAVKLIVAFFCEFDSSFIESVLKYWFLYFKYTSNDFTEKEYKI